MPEKLPSYGGQAVIEGVMMRGARVYAVAVRAPDKSIRLDTKPLETIYQSPIMKIPFLRGMLGIWDALVLGVRALTFSADVQAGEDMKLEGAPMTLTLLTSLAIGVSVFFLLPAGAAYLVEQYLGWSNWWTNVLEGLIRLTLLVVYVWAVGFIPDIRRVYAYHGAEHKTVNAFQAGSPLTVDQVASFPREHPGCGTAFLLTVAVLSILLFSALGPLPLLPRLLSRIALVPILAGIAYEYLRLGSRLAQHRWARPLIAPGLALQRLTTREPDEEMLEVAIRAFEAMRSQEGQ